MSRTLGWSRPLRMPVLPFDAQLKRSGRRARRWGNGSVRELPVQLAVLRHAPMTLEEIALVMGISREGIRVIEIRALKRFEWHWFLMYEFDGGNGWREVFPPKEEE